MPGEGGSLEIVGATCPSALQRLRTTCPARKRGTPCMTTGCLLVGKPRSASRSAIEQRNISSATLVQFILNGAQIIWSGPLCAGQSSLGGYLAGHPTTTSSVCNHPMQLASLHPLCTPGAQHRNQIRTSGSSRNYPAKSFHPRGIRIGVRGGAIQYALRKQRAKWPSEPNIAQRQAATIDPL